MLFRSPRVVVSTSREVREEYRQADPSAAERRGSLGTHRHVEGRDEGP